MSYFKYIRGVHKTRSNNALSFDKMEGACSTLVSLFMTMSFYIVVVRSTGIEVCGIQLLIYIDIWKDTYIDR